ncbi:hypothetical protein ARTHRO9AX_100103 [Arthrobacter sp. 9AX]|nr:hypothetical protein ARTHRO9AX_100103 [Arthrobacter sp. 9AX]
MRGRGCRGYFDTTVAAVNTVTKVMYVNVSRIRN